MTEFEKTWEPVWHERIELLVREKGHSSISEYARAYPKASWVGLAEQLGENVAGIQLKTMVRHEATANNQMHLFARESLVREPE